MNVIDLLVCLVLLVALWNGWRRGFILQVCSLAAIVVAIWLAARFGAAAGEALHIDPAYAPAAGFTAVLVAAVLAVAVLARILRKLFRFAGFGLLDTLLGILVAVVKYVLLLSVLFAAIDRFNVDYALIPAETVASSRTWHPIRDLSHSLLPFAGWVSGQAEEVVTTFSATEPRNGADKTEPAAVPPAAEPEAGPAADPAARPDEPAEPSEGFQVEAVPQPAAESAAADTPSSPNPADEPNP